MTRFAIVQTVHGHHRTIGTAGTPEDAEVFRRAVDRADKPARVQPLDVPDMFGQRYGGSR